MRLEAQPPKTPFSNPALSKAAISKCRVGSKPYVGLFDLSYAVPVRLVFERVGARQTEKINP
jgi:hypothetical protein